ncbi:MAG: imidazole glycerol phosphate synthase subunit HisH [Bacteroidetes bacterium]|nr:imidazole glycerol phosphate synthase subunit HisH [Bacteroidota bacterium]
MQNKVTIIDYGMGNLRSVQKKLIRVGADAIISNDLEIISKSDKLILPGVGHFENGIKNLKELGIWDVINRRVLLDKVPILGICLGMQLMAKHSEEGNVEGLSWFDATVVKFSVKNSLKYKVPHMGWNNAVIEKKSKLFHNIPSQSMYYFVHSYHICCNSAEDVLSSTEYEYKFTSSIQKENIYGTQFHPEKSHEWGEMIFKNFMEI